jgi:hypothetical protein
MEDLNLTKYDDAEESDEHTSDDANIKTLSQDEDISVEDKSRMNSEVVPKSKIMLVSTLPLKCVETESDKVETVVDTGTARGRRSKEYFDNAKTIMEAIPCIIGSSTKLKLSEMKGQDYANVNRSVSLRGDNVMKGGISMSKSTALSIEKMVNFTEAFARISLHITTYLCSTLTNHVGPR